MNLIDLLTDYSDIRYYICQFLTDEDKCINNIVCSQLNFGKFVINLPNYAASIGSISLLRYTQDMKYEWNDNICDFAVNFTCEINTLKWIIFNGSIPNKNTFRKAAKVNRLDIIIWIHNKWVENDILQPLKDTPKNFVTLERIRDILNRDMGGHTSSCKIWLYSYLRMVQRTRI